jgi:hypothetical protein
MKVLWLQSGGCGGCTQSLLGAEPRPCSRSCAMPASSSSGTRRCRKSGDEALALLKAAPTGRLPFDILCVEGALLRGPNGSGRSTDAGGQRPAADRLGRAGSPAPAVGVRHRLVHRLRRDHRPPPAITDACGLQFDGDEPGGLLGEDFRRRRPAGGQHRRLSDAPRLDRRYAALAGAGRADGGATSTNAQRPRFYAEQLVHHGCSRNEYYEFKASAQKLSDLGCLMENLGCKGTQAHADCNVRTVERRRLLPARRLCLHRLHRARLRGARPPVQETPKIAGIPIGLPIDMPKAWFVALAALSKSATPKRVRDNSRSDHPLIAPASARAAEVSRIASSARSIASKAISK